MMNTANERAARLLSQLAIQDSASLQLHVPQAAAKSASRFLRAAGQAFALTLTVAAASVAQDAHATGPVPMVSVNGGDAQPQATGQERLTQVFTGIMNNLDDAITLSQIYLDARDCIGGSVRDAGGAKLDPAVQAVVNQQAARASREIASWVTEHPDDLRTAISAYCVNPANWREQIDTWQSRQAEVLARFQESPQQDAQALLRATQSVFDKYMDRSINEAVSRDHSVISTGLAFAIGMGEARAIKVGSHDVGQWTSAATALLGGLAEVVGGRSTDSGQRAQAASRGITRAGRMANSASNIARARSTSAQISQIGRLMGELGRNAQREDREQSRHISRQRPR